ncbi:MAG: IclR family transcriptional regulator [Paracoccaceae bacterium]
MASEDAAIVAGDAVKSDDARIPTNLRTLLILEAVGAAERPLTPAEIGRLVGLPKQTIHRLCSVLLEEGFLMRAEGGRGVRAGRRARRMSGNLLHHSAPVAARRAILERISATVGETVNFAAPGESGMIYVDRVETAWAFRIQLPIGTHVPFHCTASGKTWLASLSLRQRRKTVSSLRLERLTSRTLTDPDALLTETAEIARRGFAIDNEELMEGMIALSVPVTAPDGRYVASLAFHGPLIRLSPESLLDHLETLRGGARDLQAALF